MISIKNQIANKLAKTEADREELRRSNKQVIEANSRLKNIFLLYDLYHGMGWDKTSFPMGRFFRPIPSGALVDTIKNRKKFNRKSFECFDQVYFDYFSN